MDVKVFARCGWAEGCRVFDSQDLPADQDALTALRPRHGRQRPGAHRRRAAGLPPQAEAGDAVQHRGAPRAARSGRRSPAPRSTAAWRCIALDSDRPARRRDRASSTARVRERYPYPPSNRRELSHRGGACGPRRRRRRVRRRPVRRGRRRARADRGGRPGRPEPVGRRRAAARASCPGWRSQLARLRFGTVGPSNHFVELQAVEEMLDPEAAERARRPRGPADPPVPRRRRRAHRRDRPPVRPPQDYPRQLRAAMAVQKPLFHLATARSLRRSCASGWRCTSPTAARRSTLDSDEGQRLMLANAAAMNYGFAFRMATYAALRALAAETFGGAPGRLVVDSPHNSIYEEDVDGEPGGRAPAQLLPGLPGRADAAGHRFAQTGQAVLLPGHAPHLVLPRGRRATGAQRSLHSACHGAGTVVDQFAERGLSRSDPARRRTLRYRYSERPRRWSRTSTTAESTRHGRPCLPRAGPAGGPDAPAGGAALMTTIPMPRTTHRTALAELISDCCAEITDVRAGSRLQTHRLTICERGSQRALFTAVIADRDEATAAVEQEGRLLVELRRGRLRNRGARRTSARRGRRARRASGAADLTDCWPPDGVGGSPADPSRRRGCDRVVGSALGRRSAGAAGRLTSAHGRGRVATQARVRCRSRGLSSTGCVSPGRA